MSTNTSWFTYFLLWRGTLRGPFIPCYHKHHTEWGCWAGRCIHVKLPLHDRSYFLPSLSLPPSLSVSPSVLFYICTIQGICNIPHRQRKSRIFMFLGAPPPLTMNEIFLKGISAEALTPEQISRTSDYLFLMYFYLTSIYGVPGLCQPLW